MTRPTYYIKSDKQRRERGEKDIERQRDGEREGEKEITILAA